MSFFITHIQDPEWGDYYELAKPGYIALIALIILAIAVAAIIVGRKQKTERFSSKTLAFAGIALALAFATSFVKLEMPMGGSVTLFSMFFITYIGYVYGINVGLVTAFAYSLLQFIQSGGSYFLSPFQTFLRIYRARTFRPLVQEKERPNYRIYRSLRSTRIIPHHRRIYVLDGLYARLVPQETYKYLLYRLQLQLHPY